MSNTIDERVVVLRFDNDQFESATKTSRQSLQDLNNELKNSNGAEGLREIGVAANSINLDRLADSVEAIAQRFTKLGMIGAAAINNLTTTILGKVKNIVMAVPNQIRQGGLTRALNIEQARFKIKGLGQDWDKLYKDMDYAVAGTAYGIDQAANAAAQLAASGVKAGTDMKAALRGVSGVAAMTGSSYDDISRIFTRVAGQGKMMAVDLNSISARGLNAAVELSKYFNGVNDGSIKASDSMKAMVKNATKGAKTTEATIREMTHDGVINFEMFSKAMDNAFGENATKANDTYNGSLSNIKAALSRIGEDRQKVRIENLMNIFNALLPVVNELRNILAPMTTALNRFALRGGKTLINFLHETYDRLKPLSDQGKKVRDQFDEYFDKVKKVSEKTRHSWADHVNGVEEGAKTEIKALSKMKHANIDHNNQLVVTQKEMSHIWEMWRTNKEYSEEYKNTLEKQGYSYDNLKEGVARLRNANFNMAKSNIKVVKSGEEVRKALEDQSKAAKEQPNAWRASETQFIKSGQRVQNELENSNKLTRMAFRLNNEYTDSYPPLINNLRLVISTYRPFISIFRIFRNLVLSLKNIGRGLLSVIEPIFSALSINILPAFGKFIRSLKNGSGKLVEWTSNLRLSKEAQTKLYNAVNGFFKMFRKAGSFFKPVFKRIKDTFVLLGKQLRPAVEALGNAFKKIFSKIKSNGALLKLFEIIGGALYIAINSIITAVQKLITTVGPFLKKLFASEGFQHLKTAIVEIAKALWKLAGKGLKNISDFFTSLMKGGKSVNGKTAKNVTTVADGFSKLADKVAKFLDNIREGKGPFALFIKLFSKLKGIKGPLGFFKALAVHAKSLFGGIKGGNSVLGLLSGFLGKAKNIGAVKAIMKFFKDFDIKSFIEWLLPIVKQVIKLWALVKTVKSMSGMMDAFAGVAKSIKGLVGTLTLTADQYRKKLKMETFRVIASSVLMLAGAMWILAAIPPDKMKQAGIAIGSLFGAVVGSIITLGKIKMQPGRIEAIGTAFAGMGASMLLLAFAMRIIGGMKPDALLRAGTAIVGFTGMFVAASKLIGKEGLSSGAAFVGMAFAIDLLVPAMLAFAKMNWATILKGGGVIVALMFSLAAAAKFMATNKEKAVTGAATILAMAFAIDLLAIAMKIIASISVPDVKKGLAVIETVLWSLTGASKVITGSRTAPKTLRALSRSILMIAAALAILTLLDPARLALSAFALNGTIIVVTACLTILEDKVGGDDKSRKLLKAALILGLVIGEVAGIFIALDKLQVGNVLQNATGMSEVLIASTIALGVLGKLNIDPIKAAEVAGDIGILIGAIGTLFTGIGLLCEKVEPIEGLLYKGTEIVGNVIGKFAGTVVKAFKEAAGIEDANKKAEKGGPVQRFVDNMIVLVEKLGEIKDIGDLSKAVKNLGTGLLEFTKAEFRNSLNEMSGIESDGITSKIEPLADAIIAYSKKFEGQDLSVVKTSTEAAKNIASVADSLGPFKNMSMEGLTSNIVPLGLALSLYIMMIRASNPSAEDIERANNVTGVGTEIAGMYQAVPRLKYMAMTGFSGNLAPLASAIVAYMDTINDHEWHAGDVVRAKLVTSVGMEVAQMTQEIARFKNVAEWGFINRLPKLAENLVKYISTINDNGGVTAKDVTNAKNSAAVGEALGDIADGISLLDESRMNTFINKAKGLGTAVTEFATEIKGTKFSDAQKQIVQKVGEALSDLKMPSTDVLGWYNSNLPKLGTNIKQFFEDIGSVDTTKIDTVIDSINKLGGADYSGANEALEQLGKTTTANVSSSMNSGSSKATVNKSASSLASGAATSVSKQSGKMKTAGSALSAALAKGLSGSTAKIKTAASKAVNAYSSNLTKGNKSKTAGEKLGKQAASGVTKSESNYKTSADNAAKGYASQINGKVNRKKVYDAAYKLGQHAHAGFKKGQQEGSPSKLFMKSANYSVLGFVIGLKKYGNLAYNAAYDLGTGITDAVSNAIDLTSSIMENGVDPTISPVVDLSNVRNGVGQIDSMFSGNRLAPSFANNINANLQNGSNSLESTVSNLTKRLDSLTDTMNSRQMINYITIDGAQDPELFADKLVRKLKIDMRSM